jgi:ligand-binding SRPBCC domain-containing protein
MEGVNDELRPWVRMSVPREARGRHLDEVPIDQVAFRSWLLLFGVVPFDAHHVRLVSVDAGRRFLERSFSVLQAVWEHERTVEPVDGGTRITDRVKVRPRLPIALTRPIVATLFTHRHRRLRRAFG